MSTRVFLDGVPLGSRVVVRYRLAGETAPSGRPLATDVIGLLRGWDLVELIVEDRTGGIVTIAQSAIVAAKRVPPAPRR